MSLFRGVLNVSRRISSLLSSNFEVKRSFHLLSNKQALLPKVKEILKPIDVNIVPTCGLKIRGMLHKRCKDCYFVRRQEKWYVMCKTHPRHKQVQMKADERKSWILSHATQGKVRPW